MKARIRLIDANKLQTTTTYFGISDTPVEVVKKSVIDNAKTIEAVPLSVIENIKTELPDHSFWQDAGGEPLVAIRDVIEIIDCKIAEVTDENICR